MNSKRILIVSQYPPQPDRDSGSLRMMSLLELLRLERWSITFASSRGVTEIRDVRRLQQVGVAFYDCTRMPLEDLLMTGRFDLALIAFWPVAETCLPVIRRVSPRTRIIVDSVDVHFVRNARRIFSQASKQGIAGRLDTAFCSELGRELNTYAAADAVLTVSSREAELIGELVPEPGLAHCVPDTEDLAESPVPALDRRGIVFVGSFRHEPNVQAVEFLCREVVPRLDVSLMEQHPIYVVGEGMEDHVRRLGEGQPHVRMVGWVPSALPYLEQARVSVVPVQYGAGTKRKLLQSLMVGTPAVSTHIGVEGFGLLNGEHVLVADDPAAFASAIERLALDDLLWQRLSQQGRAHVVARHGRTSVRARLRKALEIVMAAEPKHFFTDEAADGNRLGSMDVQSYNRLRQDIRQMVKSHVPAGSTVIVVSRGDEELLKLDGRTGWHLPRTPDGTYAGHHPSDSADAVAQLEALRKKGGKYLLLPSTMMWWLEHYRGFAEYLGKHSRSVFHRPDVCAIHEFVANGPHDTQVKTSRIAPLPSMTADLFSHQENRRCALLTVGDWDTLRQWRECVDSHAAYCRKFGHAWIVVSSPLSSKPSLSWNDWSWQKIYALQQAMERFPDGAYLMLVDADVLIAHNTPDWTQEEWCNRGTSLPFVFMAKGHSGRFNAGVQMYRNCPEARSFLRVLIGLHQNPRNTPAGYAPLPPALQSFFLAENGPIIHLTSCRPEIVEEIPAKWNNTSEPGLADHLRHFTGPMKGEFQAVARRRPVALVVLNTPWHFECVAPWIYYLVQLGFAVHIDTLHIADDPENLASLAGLRYAGPFTQKVSLFETYTTAEGRWAQRFLRLKGNAVPTASYSVVVVLSHYAYWERPFAPKDADAVARTLKVPACESLPVLLYYHTTVAGAGKRSTIVDVAGEKGSLVYVPCCTTRHAFEAMRKAADPVHCAAGYMVPLYTKLWTSSFEDDSRRWKERKTARFIVQGRLAPGHRAYQKLVQAINALPDNLRKSVKFTLIGFGDRAKLLEHLHQSGLSRNDSCIEVLSNLDTTAFDQQLAGAHILFDCLDGPIMEREQYLVDRLTSSVTRALPLCRPMLCHGEIARIYGVPAQACETYGDDPRTLANAIAKMIRYTDTEYEQKCIAMRRFCLRVHDQNVDNLHGLLNGRIANLPHTSASVSPFSDALRVTEGEALEPSFGCATNPARHDRPETDAPELPNTLVRAASKTVHHGRDAKITRPRVQA
jgi:glycosyltransferase involved in cell wall biosynthesis